MRILQVTDVFDLFGVTNVCYNVQKELVKRNHDVTLIASDFGLSDDITTTFERAGTCFIPFRCETAVSSFYFSPSMKRWLDENLKDFDVIHMHNFRCYQHIITHKYAEKYGIPYVLQPHGSLLPFFQRRTQKRLFDLLWGRSILNYAAKLIALTPAEQEQYEMMGITQDRTAIVPNGIDATDYINLPSKTEFRTRYGIDNDEKMVLSLGKLHRIKGVDLLIKAFAKLSEKIDGAKLVIAGPDVGALGQLKTLVSELKLSDSVMFVGPLRGQNKLEAYVDADVYVLPSVHETFGLTVLEACACGTPVIVSATCGIADLVRDFGCVVDRDPDELCDAMQKVLSLDATGKDLGAMGRRFVLKEMTWEKAVQRIEEVYTDVASRAA